MVRLAYSQRYALTPLGLQVDISVGGLRTSLYHLKVRYFLLGYGVVHLLTPFLLQPDIPPDNERLLELREEVLDLDHFVCCHQTE